MTENPVHRQALTCAERGWPVFPCQPGRKTPAAPHGYLDATTDPARIRAWFARRPELNLAVATGAPGPDVLDIDNRGEAGDGFPALARLTAAGLLDSSTGTVRTPSGGLHLYFSGSAQRSGHLPACHIDFLSNGGYVLTPPSQISGLPYQHATGLATHGDPMDWPAVLRLLDLAREHQRPAPGPAADQPIEALTRWLAAQREGNRNSGLFWAVNRALETDPAADLSPLAAAARQAGLDDPEITKTLNSARRTAQARPCLEPPDRQPEGAS
jgi:Bifunctional DNA primase/polymerase, N-terminal